MKVTLEDLQRQRQHLKRVWTRYIHAGPASSAAPSLTQAVTRSWERSSHHLTPLSTHVPLERGEVEREWRDSLLYQAAKPLLADIERAANESSYVVAICNSAGKILWTYSSQHMRPHAEKLNFVPGGLVDEINAGTNALALALRTLEPTKVFSAEHYARGFHDWVCYSAPICDPQGKPLGVIDFSSTWDNTNAMGLLTVIALARCLEERLIQLSLVSPGARASDAAEQIIAGWDEAAQTEQPTRAALSGVATAGLVPLRLKLCGTPHVQLWGKPLKLTPRQLEILALLALHAEGLSLDTLYTYLYSTEEVSFSTLKAEVSVLRSRLQGHIGSRPYRLTLPFEADVVQVQTQLKAGDLEAVLATYSGSVLPRSDSPRLAEWRNYLDEAVGAAVLQAGDSDLMWRYSALQPDDLEVCLRLAERLAATDPRLALVKAKLRRLQAEITSM